MNNTHTHTHLQYHYVPSTKRDVLIKNISEIFKLSLVSCCNFWPTCKQLPICNYIATVLKHLWSNYVCVFRVLQFCVINCFFTLWFSKKWKYSFDVKPKQNQHCGEQRAKSWKKMTDCWRLSVGKWKNMQQSSICALCWKVYCKIVMPSLCMCSHYNNNVLYLNNKFKLDLCYASLVFSAFCETDGKIKATNKKRLMEKNGYLSWQTAQRVFAFNDDKKKLLSFFQFHVTTSLHV